MVGPCSCITRPCGTRLGLFQLLLCSASFKAILGGVWPVGSLPRCGLCRRTMLAAAKAERSVALRLLQQRAARRHLPAGGLLPLVPCSALSYACLGACTTPLGRIDRASSCCTWHAFTRSDDR